MGSCRTQRFYCIREEVIWAGQMSSEPEMPISKHRNSDSHSAHLPGGVECRCTVLHSHFINGSRGGRKRTTKAALQNSIYIKLNSRASADRHEINPCSVRERGSKIHES